MKNMQAEQEKCNGAIPFFVPRPKVKKKNIRILSIWIPERQYGEMQQR